MVRYRQVENPKNIERGKKYMIKVIMGPKGTGKTQKVVSIVNSAVETEKGSVVCIEHGKRLTYDVNYKVRLIDITHYPVSGYESLAGFISGLYAGNYDTTHVVIDSLYKIAGDSDAEHAEKFLDWLEKFREENGVQFTVLISAPSDDAPEGIKKYF